MKNMSIGKPKEKQSEKRGNRSKPTILHFFQKNT